MELVLLQDTQGGYASNWFRIANTTGVSEIQIGDRFREQGFGAGAEELEVAGIDISVVGGASRLFFNRAANATQPEVHRLGAVLLQVGIKSETEVANEITQALVPETASDSIVEKFALDDPRLPAMVAAGAVVVEDVPLKRGRGRPKGSKNKAHEEVAFPAGF